MLKSKIHIFFIAIMFFVIADSCRKKEDLVPNVLVNFNIFLSDPEFATLQTIGNYVFVTGGVSGIVIYRNSQVEFTAFDRCCTFQPNDRCGVLPDSTNSLFLKCPCCGSKFTIINGTLQSGSATRSLTLYAADFDGNNMLHVHN